jgi:hypothetical protein
MVAERQGGLHGTSSQLLPGERLPDNRPLYEGLNVCFDPLQVIVAFEGVTEPEVKRFQSARSGSTFRRSTV